MRLTFIGNVTTSDAKVFEKPTLVAPLVALHTALGLVAAPGNALVLWLTATNAELKCKLANIFIFNLALCDFVYSLALVLQVFTIILTDDDQVLVLCKLVGFLQYTAGLATFYVTPLIALNRYFVLCRGMESVFSKRRIIFMSFYCWLHSLAGVLPFAAYGALGQDIFGTCGVVARDSLALGIYFNAFNMISVRTGYISVVICYKKVYQWFSEKREILKSNPNAEIRQRVRETGSTLKLISAICIAPLIFQGPAVIFKPITNFLSYSIPVWLAPAIYSTFPLTSLFNPWVTLLIMRPYKRAAANTLLVGNCLRRFTKISPVSSFNTNRNTTKMINPA